MDRRCFFANCLRSVVVAVASHYCPRLLRSEPIPTSGTVYRDKFEWDLRLPMDRAKYEDGLRSFGAALSRQISPERGWFTLLASDPQDAS